MRIIIDNYVYLCYYNNVNIISLTRCKIARNHKILSSLAPFYCIRKEEYEE
nr:MAG TPA: E2-like protein [Caudoviricetes sp.]